MSELENEALKGKTEGDRAALEKAGEVGDVIRHTAVKGYKAIEKGVTQGYKKIEEGVVGGYKKIEEGVIGGYKKIEDGVVDGFNKVADKFVDKFLTHEGESMEDAKKRLAEEQAARGQASKEAAKKRAASQQARTGVGTDIGKAGVEASNERERASVAAHRMRE